MTQMNEMIARALTMEELENVNGGKFSIIGGQTERHALKLWV